MLSLAQKRSRLLLALAVALLVLAGLRLMSPTEAPPARLSNLRASDVTTLAFEVRDGTTMTLEKTATNWLITQPWHRRADASRVQVLLSVLTLPAPSLYATDELSLPEIGLAEPLAKLTIDGETFYFGAQDSTQRRRYVQQGTQVALLSDLAFPVMQQQPDYFANLSAFPPGLTGISTPDWTLSKTDNLWDSGDMTQAQSETLVRRWLNLRASRILPWPLPANSLPDAVAAIPITITTAAESFGYVIYQLEDLTLIHADSADHVMAVEPAATEALLRIPDDA